MEIIQNKKIIAVMILMVMIISMTCPVFAAKATSNIGGFFQTIVNFFVNIFNSLFSKSKTQSLTFSNPTTGNITQKFSKSHNGLDIANSKGTKISAAAGGTVELVKYSNTSYGNQVLINHGNGFKTRYAHLDTISVKEGDKVSKGGKIGTMGNTGNVRGVTGVHLHFEIIDNGTCVDPQKYVYKNL